MAARTAIAKAAGIISAVGSGTAAFALSPEPLPAVRPNLAPAVEGLWPDAGRVVVRERCATAEIHAPHDIVGSFNGAVEVVITSQRDAQDC